MKWPFVTQSVFAVMEARKAHAWEYAASLADDLQTKQDKIKSLLKGIKAEAVRHDNEIASLNHKLTTTQDETRKYKLKLESTMFSGNPTVPLHIGCAGCAHWRSEDNGEMGRCDMSGEPNPDDNGVVSIAWSSCEGLGIFCGPKYACLHHKPK